MSDFEWRIKNLKFRKALQECEYQCSKKCSNDPYELCLDIECRTECMEKKLPSYSSQSQFNDVKENRELLIKDSLENIGDNFYYSAAFSAEDVSSIYI